MAEQVKSLATAWAIMTRAALTFLWNFLKLFWCSVNIWSKLAITHRAFKLKLHLELSLNQQGSFFNLSISLNHRTGWGWTYRSSEVGSHSTGCPAGTFALCYRWHCACLCSCSGWPSPPSVGHQISGRKEARWVDRTAPLSKWKIHAKKSDKLAPG